MIGFIFLVLLVVSTIGAACAYLYDPTCRTNVAAFGGICVMTGLASFAGLIIYVGYRVLV